MMKKILKWAGIILLALIILSAIYGTFGLKKTLSLDIQGVDLDRIPDGVYTGSYENFRWSNSVEVTVSDHRITKIEPRAIQQGREKIIETLTQRILESQANDVDAVSGATASSNCFLKAVENALQNAGK